MYLDINTVRKLFPRFDFKEPDNADVELRQKKGVGTRPSYDVQVMQSGGAIFVGGTLQEQIVTPAKIVQSTSAEDLALPIRAFIPTEALNALPASRPLILSMHADSVAANKLVLECLASSCSNIPVHDGLCFGRLASQHLFWFVC